MGGRSSPGLLDHLPVALEWISSTKYGVNYLCHLLDDFFTGEPHSMKGRNLEVILRVFKYLGLPVAPGKVEGPGTTLEFLGITLDSVAYGG